MTDAAPSGSVRTETDGRVCKITVDNAAKKNAFTPDMMQQLSEALTTFDDNDEQWVAVVCFAGDHTTAGLDMPRFFGPNRERRDSPPARCRSGSCRKSCPRAGRSRAQSRLPDTSRTMHRLAFAR